MCDYMIEVLILDTDIYYCNSFCEHLNTITKDFTIFTLKTYIERYEKLNSEQFVEYFSVYNISLLPLDFTKLVIIYNQIYFHNPPILENSLLLTETPTLNSDCKFIYKFDFAQNILNILESFVDANNDLKKIYKHNNLLCITGIACHDIRNNEIFNIRQHMQNEGYKVVQIDFCPPHFGNMTNSAQNNNTLTDALLRIMADDLSFEELGTFLDMRSDGTMQFRPIHRTDDLFECEIEIYRKFVELLRNWIEYSNYTHFVIINCYAIPFNIIYTVSVLCDQLLILNQNNLPINNFLHNKELANLLPNLPSSCVFEERLIG